MNGYGNNLGNNNSFNTNNANNANNVGINGNQNSQFKSTNGGIDYRSSLSSLDSRVSGIQSDNSLRRDADVQKRRNRGASRDSSKKSGLDSSSFNLGSSSTNSNFSSSSSPSFDANSTNNNEFNNPSNENFNSSNGSSIDNSNTTNTNNANLPNHSLLNNGLSNNILPNNNLINHNPLNNSKNVTNKPQNQNGLADRGTDKAIEVAASSINPLLGKIAKTKTGKNLFKKALSKNRFLPKNLLPTNGDGKKIDSEGNDVEDKEGENRLENMSLTIPKKVVKYGIPILVCSLLFSFLIVFLMISDQAHIGIYGLDLASQLTIDDFDIADNIIDLNYDESNNSNPSSSSSKKQKPLSPTGNQTIDKLNKIAVEQVGNTGDKYESWYGMYADWCAMFVSWLFNQVGGIDKYIKRSAIAGEIPRASDAAGLGVWYEDECTDPSSVPKAGDVIVYDPWIGGSTIPYPNNGNDKYYSSHVGYIYKVDGQTIYSVEGNGSSGGYNGVWYHEHDRKYCGSGTQQGINGYFRPNY